MLRTKNILIWLTAVTFCFVGVASANECDCEGFEYESCSLSSGPVAVADPGSMIIIYGITYGDGIVILLGDGDEWVWLYNGERWLSKYPFGASWLCLVYHLDDGLQYGIYSESNHETSYRGEE